jgi:DNA-binding LytR/AlgR family response regulator
MSALKIGIVEDELVIGRTILNTLEELGYTHCGPAINYTEAIEMLDEHKPDLLLLDIQLAGKKDGIDVAQKLNESYKIPFIFLTANSDGDTIERAKKVNPHAYIVKPFTKEELYAAIEIAFNNFTGSKNNDESEKPSSYQAKDYMFIRDGYIFRKVLFSELVYLESDANYVTLHLTGQKKVMVRSTLNDFMEQLDPKTFVRVHRSHAVNIHFIEEITPVDINVNGVKISVGKSFKDGLYSLLGIED